MPHPVSDQPHPGLAGARTARALGPKPDRLRGAYLDLLKLCLCDLAGTSTTSVGRNEEGVVASRELEGDQLRLRAAGMDWPLHGLTMVGLNRLDDLQACVESVVREGVEGDLIEAGSWRGGASILMRATLDSLGDRQRTLWVADSFQGFPSTGKAEGDGDQWAEMDFLEVPLEEVRENFARFGCDQGVRFVEGFFEETMPELSGRRWAIVRLDGDTYEATWVTLQHLYPGLSAGGYLIVDDYGALEDCRRAVDEFRRRHGITEALDEVDWTCVRWRREREEPTRPAGPPRLATAVNGHGQARAVSRPAKAPVPTMEELRLARENAELRERLAATEAALGKLQDAPLSAVQAWLRQALRRKP
jgi:O-methyltransferase